MTIRVARSEDHPEAVAYVWIDSHPIAVVFLDESSGRGVEAPEWCLSFIDPNSDGGVNRIANVFPGPPYESIESAVPRILDELHDWSLDEDEEMGARLKQAVINTPPSQRVVPEIPEVDDGSQPDDH